MFMCVQVYVCLKSDILTTEPSPHRAVLVSFEELIYFVAPVGWSEVFSCCDSDCPVSARWCQAFPGLAAVCVCLVRPVSKSFPCFSASFGCCYVVVILSEIYIITLYQPCDLQTTPPTPTASRPGLGSMGLLAIALVASFDTRAFSFCVVWLPQFYVIAFAFSVMLKMLSSNPSSWNTFPSFSSKRFMFLALGVWPLTHSSSLAYIL